MATCNVTADLEAFVRIWVTPWLSGPLEQLLHAPPLAIPKRSHFRDKWHVDEGVRACRARFVPDPNTGRMVGVAASNRSAPPRFFETCRSVLHELVARSS